MVSLSTFYRYLGCRIEYAAIVSRKNCRHGRVTVGEVLKNFFQEKLTYLEQIKRGAVGDIFLVRKLPLPDPTHVFVGDVVLLKDTEKSGQHIILKLAAIEGYEMVSKDGKEEPFVLEKGQCWVSIDNENITHQKNARDSRSFGPIPMSDILGRVIYSLGSAGDHGAANNSDISEKNDDPILQVELDMDEMERTRRMMLK